MASLRSDREWVDLYVRNKLTEEEVAEFEEALLESVALQAELEAVLRLRELLGSEDESQD